MQIDLRNVKLKRYNGILYGILYMHFLCSIQQIAELQQRIPRIWSIYICIVIGNLVLLQQGNKHKEKPKLDMHDLVC